MTAGHETEELDLTTRESAALAHGDTLQSDWTDRDPGQRHDLMAHFREHPANLAVFPFGQHHFHDARLAFTSDEPHALGAHLALCQPDSFGELVEDLVPRLAGNDDPIDLLDAELRMRQLVGKLSIVGQEHQPRALFVESTHSVGALRNLGEKVDHPRFSRWVVIGGDIALGLMDCVIDVAFGVDLLAVERDLLLASVHFCTELAGHFAVDGDPTLRDQLLAGAS